MGCCSGLARFLLIFFNFIFWLTGGALLGLGIWILVDPEISDYLDVLKDASSDGDFLKTTAYILIGFGVFVFVVGFCGCCGAIRKSKCLLGFYIFFLVIVFAGELAAVIFSAVYRGDVEDGLEKNLSKSIADHYDTGLKSAWDEVQKGLKCCGGAGPGDYSNVTSTKDSIPVSCCVLSDGKPKDEVKCKAQTDTFFYKTGCKNALVDWMDDNSYIVIGVGAGIAALQILIFICAVCFCRHMDDDKYSSS